MPTGTKPGRPFAGFYNPRTTPVPDNFFDEVLADLSGAEVKVLLYIFRRTFGFKRDNDNIALSQMVSGITRRDGTVLDRGTGLGKGSVARALNSLVAKGMVRKTIRRSLEKGHEPTTYEPVLSDEAPLSQNRTRGVPKWDKPLSQDGTHKKQVYKKTVRDGSPLKKLPDLDVEPEESALIVQDILAQLGDEQSTAFYRLVANKVPEPVIREALGSIKQDGARDPRRLFTFRMQKFAFQKLAGR